jgi:hypothetical protein
MGLGYHKPGIIGDRQGLAHAPGKEVQSVHDFMA